MPVGIQRLNAKRSQPNPHIVFIKPLKGPDEAVAQEFLERIAAQCVPIMRDHHLSVVTLEEYEPNAEFVGRNFNAGEVIQLVLKARFTGRWLPFPYVQMVMMHELAHCRQMNHARAFWAVRDAFAAQMRRLWSARYTGEGLWGRGAKLGTIDGGPPAAFEHHVALPGTDDDVLLEHLCGGTYRSRGRKRKRTSKSEQLTYRERQERRIRRKFGTNGVALGDDLAERAKLDAGAAGPQPDGRKNHARGGANPGRSTNGGRPANAKRLAVKPRVAVSKRGRELRAAAALARFEKNDKDTKKEDEIVALKEDDDDDNDVEAEIKREEEIGLAFCSDSDDSQEDDADADADQPDITGPDAVDIDGTRMLDGQGRGMVRVCEGENPKEDSDAQRELRELLQTSDWGRRGKQQQQQKEHKEQRPKQSQSQPNEEAKPRSPSSGLASWVKPKTEPEAPAPRAQPRLPKAEQTARDVGRAGFRVKTEVRDEHAELSLLDVPPVGTVTSTGAAPSINRTLATSTDVSSAPGQSCAVCSFANHRLALTCAVCGHVLNAAAVPGAWHCRSAACRAGDGSTRFLNAGDCGVCGACGARKGTTS
ncbi:WLM domain-containing protein [Niveomyces insectorum RCEF 264]|uniref:WLM domain-containing protein n=1 Tax=Niveomyces insectorum RCEF 264 TaxID=1081102 RepID=A0A167VHC2_9HYPO|nr:WLM domain-containing protein [Niveomyces insectorum RCEF 264]